MPRPKEKRAAKTSGALLETEKAENQIASTARTVEQITLCLCSLSMDDDACGRRRRLWTATTLWMATQLTTLKVMLGNFDELMDANGPQMMHLRAC